MTQQIAETEIRFSANKQEILKNIADLLTRNIEDVNDLSLMTGQAGIALFFNSYANDSDDDSLKEISSEILVNLYKRIVTVNIKIVTNLLPGIGWVFAYLSNQKIIDIKQDEILKGIDSVVLQHVHYQFSSMLTCGGVLSQGSYLLERYKGTEDELKKTQIIEGLASIVDELKFNYSKVVSEKNFYGPDNGQMGKINRVKKINNLSKVIYFLNQVYVLNIYNHVVVKLIKKCSEELICLIDDQTEMTFCNNNIKEFAVALNAIYSLTKSKEGRSSLDLRAQLIRLIKDLDQHISFVTESPYLNDLIISVKLLQLTINDYPDLEYVIKPLSDKLEAVILATINQNKPGHINSRIGIPNLGISNGISGAGIFLIEQLKKEAILWLDVLLLH